jgi:hypothetical protein
MNEVSHGIPENEWILIWEYFHAATNAVAYAINDMAKDDEKVPILGTSTDGVCSLDS